MQAYSRIRLWPGFSRACSAEIIERLDEHRTRTEIEEAAGNERGGSARNALKRSDPELFSIY